MVKHDFIFLDPCQILLGNVFQNWLLHYLPRDQGETDQPVFPWILLLAFLEEWSNICFLSFFTLPVTTWNAVRFLVLLLCNEIKQFIGKSSLFALEIVQHFLIPFGLQEE